MQRLLSLAWLTAMAALPFSQAAHAQRAEYNGLVATHAKANAVPEALVHRVIVRESKYQAHLVGRGGTIGLMQIKLATARDLATPATPRGCAIPTPTSPTPVKYLAGAYRAANGDASRAMSYYASGYYAAAKRQRLAAGARRGIDQFGNPVPAPADAPPELAARDPADAQARQVPAPRAGAKRQGAR